jgi:hypothetical protein
MKGNPPNFRALAIAASLALPIATTSAWAGIMVDSSAPDQAPEKNIHVVTGADAAKTKAGDVLSFLNKDQLHGSLVDIDPDSGLHWQSPEATDPILFSTGQIAQIKLDPHKTPADLGSAQRVGLTNGDQFPGNIVSLDDKALVLDTWYAGRLSIPRPMLRTIIPQSDADSVIYEGPASLDGWAIGRVGRSWTFRDGALIGSGYGTIGRDVKLPDMSSLEFDLVLRGNGQFQVGIYSDRANELGNCYLLDMNSGFTVMERFSRNIGSNPLGNAQVQIPLRRDQSHIQLLTNKDKKSIWLIVDDKLVKEWDDPAEFIGDGGSIIFSCQPGIYVKISNIKVSKWDGRIDNAPAPGGPADQDSVQLANKDRVSGNLESIQDGKAKLSSAYAELTIPVGRINEVDMAVAHSDQAKPAPSDIRAYFPGGGIVTMQLTQWDAKGCVGSSPNFGQATFSPDAFERILFNLPAQQQNQSPDDSDTDSSDPGGVISN